MILVLSLNNNNWTGSRSDLWPRHHLPPPLQTLHVVDLVHFNLEGLLQAQRGHVHPLSPRLPAQRGGVRQGGRDQPAPQETWSTTAFVSVTFSHLKISLLQFMSNESFPPFFSFLLCFLIFHESIYYILFLYSLYITCC